MGCLNDGYIYGTDAVDFSQEGWSYRYTSSGLIVDSVQVGIIQAGIALINFKLIRLIYIKGEQMPPFFMLLKISFYEDTEILLLFIVVFSACKKEVEDQYLSFLMIMEMGCTFLPIKAFLSTIILAADSLRVVKQNIFQNVNNRNIQQPKACISVVEKPLL